MLHRLVSSFKIHGYDWKCDSPEWRAFANVLYPHLSDREAQYRRAESVFSAVTIHRSPSQGSEAFLVQDDHAQEDNIDIPASEEYLQRILRQPDDDADNNDEELSSEQGQAAVDDQLPTKVRVHVGDEAVINNTPSEQPQTTSSDCQPINAGVSAELAVQNTTSTQQPPRSPTVTPTGYAEPRNNANHENVIDLTDDSVIEDSHQAEESNDVVMIDDMEDDIDIILIYPAPRRLPIRSPSVIETPTRASRYADRHVHVLD